MVKTLKKRGNSHVLLIDKAIMDQLHITAETRLQLVVSNGSLVVTPERVGVGDAEVDALSDAIFAQFDPAFVELAK